MASGTFLSGRHGLVPLHIKYSRSCWNEELFLLNFRNGDPCVSPLEYYRVAVFKVSSMMLLSAIFGCGEGMKICKSMFWVKCGGTHL